MKARLLSYKCTLTSLAGLRSGFHFLFNLALVGFLNNFASNSRIPVLIWTKMSKRGGRFTQFLVFVDLWATELISLGLLGRGKVQHKGRRRHFTDAEEMRMQMEREKRKEEWRVKGFILTS